MLRKFVLATGLCTLIAGCVYVPAASGRYLQIRTQKASPVSTQFSLRTQEDCAKFLTIIANAFAVLGNTTARQIFEIASCTDVSASADLRATTTLRDKNGVLVYVVEMIGVEQCRELVRTAQKSDTETFSECKAQ